MLLQWLGVFFDCLLFCSRAAFFDCFIKQTSLSMIRIIHFELLKTIGNYPCMSARDV